MNFKVFGTLMMISCMVVAQTWTPCYSNSLHPDTDKPMGSECINFTVPLDWTNSSGDAINLFVKRTLGNNAWAIVFVIPGGPGESGAQTDELAPIFSSFMQNAVDVYQIDHRGTGRSNRLGCSNETEDQNGSCVDELRAVYGDKIRYYTTSNAARDYHFVISTVKNNTDKQVLLYGGSYGTYLLNRILTLYPDIADAVVMDSVVGPGQYFSQFDLNLNETGTMFAQGCAADAVCGGQMGSDPYKAIGDLLAQWDSLPCVQALGGPLVFSAQQMRTTLYSLLKGSSATDTITRNLLFPLTFRMRRCNNDDRTAILHAAAVLQASQSGGGLTPLQYSKVLHNNIALSEIWIPNNGTSPSVAQVHAESDQCSIASYIGDAYASLYPRWDKYTADMNVNTWASTTKPVLLTCGKFDTQTALKWGVAAASHFTQLSQRFLMFANGIHIQLLTTPYNNPPVQGVTCGMQVIFSFLNDPSHNVTNIDVSCMSNLILPDYAAATNATKSVSMALLGTPDAYGVPTTTGSTSTASASVHSGMFSILVMLFVSIIL